MSSVEKASPLIVSVFKISCGVIISFYRVIIRTFAFSVVLESDFCLGLRNYPLNHCLEIGD